uniref:Zinc finger protein 706 n=2 Tax=Podarcis muralis TaxID=64176 RepID=A0A670K693_PODMU
MRRWRERPGLAWPDSRLSAAAAAAGGGAARAHFAAAADGRAGRRTARETPSLAHTHGLLHPHGQAAAAAAAGPRGAFRSCRRTPGRRDPHSPDMARGQQKIQSQQKNAKKQAGAKKKQGHDQKAAAKAALIYTCTVCRTQMPDPKTFKQHFESKHPKTPLPPELADVQA